MFVNLPYLAFRKLDLNIWVKRDDLTSCDLSGNKVRKLEFLLADALAGGHDCVVTAGGEQSNHCRATAVAARQLGLDCYQILRTTKAPSELTLAGRSAPDICHKVLVPLFKLIVQ
jgi:1-aminocyclopropane-1-carboxylate deaminase/D-cysteine desulfhydrase-like pyridoxal-dependent ACC family enzyme